MRQNHKEGEKLFVDYAGQTVAVVDSRHFPLSVSMCDNIKLSITPNF